MDAILTLEDLSTLAKCLRVNHIWFHEGLRHLWRVWPAKTKGPLSLTQILAKITLPRRRLYTKHIRQASLIDARKKTMLTMNSILFDMDFSKLEYLNIFLEHRYQRISLPRIVAPALKVIRIRIAIYHRSAVSSDIEVAYINKPSWHSYPRLHQAAAHIISNHIKVCLMRL